MATTGFDEPWLVIGRGQVGWFAEAPRVRGSGGTLESYAAKAANGAIVYDAAEADDRAYTRHVLNGPMLDCSLPPDGYDKFGERDREAAASMLPGLGGGFQSLAARAVVDRQWSGLDRVGVAVYMGLLRKIPGVRFGRVVDGAVLWED